MNKSVFFLSAILGTFAFGKATLTYKDATIFTNNAAAFTSKWNHIDDAKEHLDLSYFIIEGDYSSSLLAQKIFSKVEEARKNGTHLKVRILTDYYMTDKNLAFLRALDQDADIDVRRFGAPTKTLRALLDQMHVDGPLFIESLMSQNGPGLLKSLQNSKLAIAQEKIKALLADPADKNPLIFMAKIAAILKDSLLGGQGAATTNEDAKKEALAFVDGVATFLHRTHHKILLVDGKCYQTGGRNLSDAYHAPLESVLIQGNGLAKDDPNYVAGQEYPFSDLDVYTCNENNVSYDKVSNPLLASYEALWTNARTVRLSDKPGATAEDKKFEVLVYTANEKNPEVMTRDAINQKATLGLELTKVPASPIKLHSDSPLEAVWVENYVEANKYEITEAYIQALNKMKAGDEAVFANAYFYLDPNWKDTVPGLAETSGLSRIYQAFIDAGNRGAKISVYTNSILTTDLSIVNVFAYPVYKALSAAHVRLFELSDKQGNATLAKRKVSLHMKGGFLTINGGQYVFVVGSYNLDARSHSRDTNDAVFLQGPKDSKVAAAAFKAQINAENANPNLTDENGATILQWVELSSKDPKVQAENMQKLQDLSDKQAPMREKIRPFKFEI